MTSGAPSSANHSFAVCPDRAAGAPADWVYARFAQTVRCCHPAVAHRFFDRQGLRIPSMSQEPECALNAVAGAALRSGVLLEINN